MLNFFLILILLTNIFLPVRVILGDTSYKIVQQPYDNPSWVSLEENTITQFRLANNYNSIGLLAHNNLAGKHFLDLDIIPLIDIEGNRINYKVVEIREYKALSPLSVYSNFIDLRNNNLLTAKELFLEIYGIPNRLVLQTSISKYGVSSWGRKFIICMPYIEIYNSNTLLRGKYLVY
jgi:hypothetical protein